MERIYIGGFGIFSLIGKLTWRRTETLHIMDYKQRIALVDKRTQALISPAQLIRDLHFRESPWLG